MEYLIWKQSQVYLTKRQRNGYTTGDGITKENLKTVEGWGSGMCTRDFLFVDDLANAIHFCIKNSFKEDFLNVGSGKEISIKQIAIMVKNITGYKGKIFYNKSYPDGTPRRVLDITKIKKLGWKPKTNINNGL